MTTKPKAKTKRKGPDALAIAIYEEQIAIQARRITYLENELKQLTNRNTKLEARLDIVRTALYK